MAASSHVRVALCQMGVTASKSSNIAKATAMVRTASKERSASLVVLPECFNCPYGTKYFAQYAEALPIVGTPLSAIDQQASPTAAAMAALAAELNIWLIAGSIPEISVAATPTDKQLYFNTSFVLDPTGTIRGIHRKIHLFKINTPTVKFDESEVLTGGRSPTVVPMEKGLLSSGAASAGVSAGIGICFDIRYPQLAAYYAQQGTSFLVYPGAFNMVTGPPHWELAAKSRAIDAQQFVLLCSPARDEKADYVAYGHSLIVTPWGDVVAKAPGGEECIVDGVMDLSLIAQTRSRLPIAAGTRNDLYSLRWSESTNSKL